MLLPYSHGTSKMPGATLGHFPSSFLAPRSPPTTHIPSSGRGTPSFLWWSGQPATTPPRTPLHHLPRALPARPGDCPQLPSAGRHGRPGEGSGGQPLGRAGSALGRWWRGVRGGVAAGCPHHQRKKGVPCPLEGIWVVGGLLGARRELGKCPRIAPGILEVPWEQGKRMRMLLQRPVGCFVGNFFLWGAATGGLPKTLPFLA